MQVRLKTGLKAGEVIEVADVVGRAFLASGKADLVEVAEVADVAETPERPKRRTRKTGVKALVAAADALPDPETR
mgnify:CR=1 FL=1